MFNPEKLLGGMLRSGMRGRGRGRGLGALVSGGAALGLVGVAMEAVEHYMNKSSSAPQGGTAVIPPAPRPNAPTGPAGGAPPPPPPRQVGASATPPPLSPAGEGSEKDSLAVLLIRAMISAANADGVIDADERANILDKLTSVDLSKEEHQFIVHELLAPKPMQDLLGEVKSPDIAKQVYVASFLAIEVDTDAERQYMQTLARKLNMEDHVLDDIHRQLGAPTP